jgi:hypothetical protein
VQEEDEEGQRKQVVYSNRSFTQLPADPSKGVGLGTGGTASSQGTPTNSKKKVKLTLDMNQAPQIMDFPKNQRNNSQDAKQGGSVSSNLYEGESKEMVNKDLQDLVNKDIVQSVQKVGAS